MSRFQVTVRYYRIGAKDAEVYRDELLEAAGPKAAEKIARQWCKDARAKGYQSLHFEVLPWSPLFGAGNGDPLARFRGWQK